jgi:hypothetical protein
MDTQAIEYRDRVLRDYFKGRNWDSNSEYELKRKLVLDSHQLLPNYPYVIEDEWEVEVDRADHGRGDLVFTDGEGNFAVIELKWIDLVGVGKAGTTKRASNRKKRRKVEEQAARYAGLYKKYLEQKNIAPVVNAFIFTNEDDYPRSIVIQEE